jgi:hypothetical protein
MKSIKHRKLKELLGKLLRFYFFLKVDPLKYEHFRNLTKWPFHLDPWVKRSTIVSVKEMGRVKDNCEETKPYHFNDYFER